MKPSDILKLRLHHTGLARSPFQSATEAVAHLGAVQAQDFGAAKWALGMRVRKSSDEGIEKAFNEGAILRTHVLRPTWHFVMPEDIRWMLELTTPRVKAFMSSYNRKLELDARLFAKSNKTIVKALEEDVHLTRQELKAILTKTGIKTDVQRLAHIIMQAELDGLICSGPRRGKQFTYALLEERVPKVKKLTREHGLARLALNYFSSHGPAQLKDFSWWSGLASKDAQAALDSTTSRLESATVDSKLYWFTPSSRVAMPKAPFARLLSIYDEYTIAYKDRSYLGDGRIAEKLIAMGNALTSVIILDGKIAGTWKRELKTNSVELALSPFQKPTKAEMRAIEAEVERYGKFLGLPARVR